MKAGLIAFALLAIAPASAAHAQATDGFISTLAQVGDPADVAYAGDVLLVADRASNFIRGFNPNGSRFNAAGTGDTANNCNDGTEDLTQPRGVTAGAPGGGFLVTSGNCIMRILSNGNVVRFAGASDGGAGASGDGGSARAARLRAPSDMAVGPDGSVYIADTANGFIRQVLPNGQITTVVTGLSNPRDVAVLADDSLLITDTGNDRVLRITPEAEVTTLAGTDQGFSGDGDPATTAQLDNPTSLVILPNSGFLVADADNNRVRRVTPLGAIFTVAGGGESGVDGGLAKDAQLDGPAAITARPGGGFTIADTGNNRVRGVTDVGAVPGATMGRSFNVSPNAGDVTVRPVGQPAFLPLKEDDLVPLRSKVDARGGRIDIAVRRADTTLEPALVFDGLFKPVALTDDVTGLRMIEPLGCATGPRAFLAKKPKKQRRLWTDAKGKYRIKGRYVGALERGTYWRVTDTCDSSEVTVFEGSVLVRNRLNGQTRIVNAGQSFTVRARSKRRGQARSSGRVRDARHLLPAALAKRG